MFDDIYLMKEQVDLLKAMVEAQRSMPRDQRHQFLLARTFDGDFLWHQGFSERELRIYHGDLDVLAQAGLVTPSYGSGRDPNYEVHPRGYQYYEWLHQQAGQSVEHMEAEIKSYLDAEDFQRRHPLAYQKWTGAAGRLWSSDSEAEWTTIGHLCREAMQEFADDLVRQFRPEDVTDDKAKTVARLRAVLNVRKSRMGDSEAAFLDALLPYWGTVNDLIQRQEHDSQKEGVPLVWEDARRVVFQTAVVMFEIDRALRRMV